MDLQDEPEYDDDYESGYQDKIYISTSVSKKRKWLEKSHLWLN